MRLVNSGLGTSASWDNEFDSLSRGWRVFLRMLQWTLEQHPKHDLAMTIRDWDHSYLWVEIYPAPRARVVKLTLSLYGAGPVSAAAIEHEWRERLAALFADLLRT